MSFRESSLKEIFAVARGIHFAMRNGQISYQEAKGKTKPLLDFVNSKITEIAQKHRTKPRKLTFQDLGRSF